MQHSDPPSLPADQRAAIRGYFVPVLELERTRPVTFAELLQAVRSKWPLILGCALLGLSVGLAAGFLMKRTYEGRVVFMVVEEDPASSAIGGLAGQFGGLASLAGIDLLSGSHDAEYMAILTSRGFIERFITDENLLPILFAERWDTDTNTWRPGLWRRPPTMAEAVRYFEQKVRAIAVDRRTDIITMTIEWPDPEVAARWAGVLISRANNEIRQQVIDESRRNMEYLDREASKTSVVGVQQSIYRLVEHEVRRGMLANARDQYAFRVLDPAVVPAVEDYVKPKRALLAVAGFALGLLGSIFIVIARALYRREG
jgi:LPS O-antigen subunit length determinant protein (WzzB/FepE family)